MATDATPAEPPSGLTAPTGAGVAGGIAARLDRLPVPPNGLGPLIGEYTFGFIGDRFGRKKSMVASCAIAGLIVIPEGYTTSWPVLMVIVTLAGLGVGGTLVTAPNFDRYAVPERERGPVGEVFKGQYLERTVVLLAVWLLLYAGIDYGFNSYSGVYVVDNGWSAHDLFVMILIGGSFGIVGLAVNSFITNLYNYTASAYPTRVRSVGTGWTDGVGHAGAVAGPLIAGALFAVTASNNHIAWFLWFTIAGSLLPGFMLLFLGMKQKRAVLEVISK